MKFSALAGAVSAAALLAAADVDLHDRRHDLGRDLLDVALRGLLVGGRDVEGGGAVEPA